MSEVRINAIRKMYNGGDGEHIHLAGEAIYSWVLLDENGEVADYLELDDVEIVEAYNENTIWMEPEHENVG